MKKLAIMAATMAVLPVLATTSAFAASPGHLAGGDLYQANGNNYVTATCGDTVNYSFKLSNTEYGMIYGVKVSASLAGNSATATGTNSSNEQVSMTDTVHVSVTKGSLDYVAGSTKLTDANHAQLATLPDGVTTGGVTAGNLAGSTKKFVEFQAKVNCPTTPTTPETPKTPGTPVELPQTGATGAFAIIASLVTLVAGYIVTTRKNVLG